MLKNGLFIVVLAFLTAGCGGMKAQTYVMTTQRVDIDNKNGNSGFVQGKGQYQEPVRKTRKVYVFELTKPVPESEVKKVEQEVQSAPQQEVAQVPVAPKEPTPAVVKASPRRIVIPKIDDEPASLSASAPAVVEEAGPKEAVTYKVQKDDTLQKIAKKFYGSFGKWIRIYDANKEKLKNPNVVRPGTVLTIPAVGEKK